MNSMRRVAVVLLILLFTTIAAAGGGSVRVRGYTRKDGTYVAPHYRSAPDGNFSNNWSTRGNVNPYTGKAGTRTQAGSSGRGLPRGPIPPRMRSSGHVDGYGNLQPPSGLAPPGETPSAFKASPEALPLIQDPNGSVPLKCAGPQAVWEHLSKKMAEAQKNNTLTWEVQSKYHEAAAEWLTCIVQGQHAYINTLQVNYNSAADGFNQLMSSGMAELVNARIAEVQDAYTTCDKAVPNPDEEEGVCLAEEAIWRCTQSNARRFIELERQRPGGTWGHAIRAISAGMFERKLALQACQLKALENAVGWCVGRSGKDARQKKTPEAISAPPKSRAVPHPKPKRKPSTFVFPPQQRK